MTKEEALEVLTNHFINRGANNAHIEKLNYKVGEPKEKNGKTSFIIRVYFPEVETTPIGQEIEFVDYYVDSTGRCLPLPV